MFHCKYSLAHKARHSLQTNKGCCRHAYIQGSHGLQTHRQGMLQACRHLDKRRRDIQIHKGHCRSTDRQQLIKKTVFLTKVKYHLHAQEIYHQLHFNY